MNHFFHIRTGNAKFGGEEVLVDQRKDKGGFPWLSFRYADVIGYY